MLTTPPTPIFQLFSITRSSKGGRSKGLKKKPKSVEEGDFETTVDVRDGSFGTDFCPEPLSLLTLPVCFRLRRLRFGQRTAILLQL